MHSYSRHIFTTLSRENQRELLIEEIFIPTDSAEITCMKKSKTEENIVHHLCMNHTEENTIDITHESISVRAPADIGIEMLKSDDERTSMLVCPT